MASSRRAAVLRSEPPVGERIDALVKKPATRKLVGDYFNDPKGFASAMFNDLRPNDPFEISAVDLFAVSLLDVRVPPKAARRLLRSDRVELTRELLDVPVDLSIWDATDGQLKAAEAVWRTLKRGRDGVGWVTAGKLLARKRPNLVPVLDEVVVTTLELPTRGAWKALRAALSDHQRRSSIDRLRPTGLSPFVSTLRILDVAVWMTSSNSKRAKVSQEEAESELDVRPI